MKTHRHLKYLKTFMPVLFPGQRAIREWHRQGKTWIAKRTYDKAIARMRRR